MQRRVASAAEEKGLASNFSLLSGRPEHVVFSTCIVPYLAFTFPKRLSVPENMKEHSIGAETGGY